MSDSGGNLQHEIDELRKERDYYKQRADEVAGEAVKHDFTVSGLRHELKQKQQGFALLSELQQYIGSRHTLAEIFHKTISGINATLGMDTSIVLVATDDAGVYRPDDWVGFAPEDDEPLRELRVELCDVWIRTGEPCIVNEAAAIPPYIAQLREAFGLPYFIILPVLVSGEPVGLLLAGRHAEQKPFAPPLDQGDADTLQAVAALIAAFVHNRDVAALKEDNEMLRYLATVDKLTGIANRRRFEEALHQEWRRAARRGTPLSLFMLDVDHFKQCNDKFGHEVGDTILKQVAERMTHGLRPGDVGARYGGEEFAVILPDTGSVGAYAAAERVRAAMEASPLHHGDTVHSSEVTVSIGVATVVPNSAIDANRLLNMADQALYAAKDAGRNRVIAALSES